jgi:hypothetical protein
VGVAGLCSFGVLLFIVTVGILLKTSKMSNNDNKLTTSDRIASLISITVSWLQILSSLTITYKMAWPPIFASYSKGTGTVANLEFMALLSFSNCHLAVSFIDKFLLQILGPPIFVSAVFFAWLIVKIACRSKKDRKKVESARRGQALQLVIVIIQLLYPKLSTITFQMFRCIDLGPISSNQLGLLLDADLSVTCFEGVHIDYVPFAIGSIVIFLIGIPLMTFVLLYRNRKRFHLASVRAEYGDLYKPYDDAWYFWECILMVQKCLLTGAMCAIMPGSPVQLLVALFVIQAYLLLVLKAGPYRGVLEDKLAFLTSLCLVLSLILGFAIITDNPDEQVFDVAITGIVLVVINMVPFLLLVFAVFKVLKKGSNAGVIDGSDGGDGISTRTQVHPTGDRRLTKQISLNQVRTVVTKNKVTKLQQSHAESHKCALEKIRHREKQADARVRQRLMERRRLKTGGAEKNKTGADGHPQTTTKDVQSIPNDQSLVLVEKVRLSMKGKIQTLQRLRKVFAKLDVDANGLLSKEEFDQLVNAILKKKHSLDKKTLRLVWEATWEQRKCGAKDELDTATLGHWLRLEK